MPRLWRGCRSPTDTRGARGRRALPVRGVFIGQRLWRVWWGLVVAAVGSVARRALRARGRHAAGAAQVSRGRGGGTRRGCGGGGAGCAPGCAPGVAGVPAPAEARAPLRPARGRGPHTACFFCQRPRCRLYSNLRYHLQKKRKVTVPSSQ